MGHRASGRTKGFMQADAGVIVNTDVVFFGNAGTPTNGTSGTGVGFAGPGSLCSDYTNAVLYINTGTKASPTWTVAGTQS